jgi:peptidyl-tRNA hydrolase ICT1
MRLLVVIMFCLNYKLIEGLLLLSPKRVLNPHLGNFFRLNSRSLSGKNKDIEIPMDKVQFKYARSGGPGGQNVNKVNSKAEIRFHVDSADWLPEEVKGRLSELHGNKINNLGELVVTCQEHRSQAYNKDEAIAKVRSMVAEAYVEPKDRHMWEGIGEKGKKIRRQEKSKRSETKQNRTKNFSKDLF